MSFAMLSPKMPRKNEKFITTINLPKFENSASKDLKVGLVKKKKISIVKWPVLNIPRNTDDLAAFQRSSWLKPVFV